MMHGQRDVCVCVCDIVGQVFYTGVTFSMGKHLRSSVQCNLCESLVDLLRNSIVCFHQENSIVQSSRSVPKHLFQFSFKQSEG